MPFHVMKMREVKPTALAKATLFFFKKQFYISGFKMNGQFSNYDAENWQADDLKFKLNDQSLNN